MPTTRARWYEIYIWQQDKPITGVPPVSTGHFDFLARTNDLGKAQLLGSLLDNAGHKAVISSTGGDDETRMKQLRIRYPKNLFELAG